MEKITKQEVLSYLSMLDGMAKAKPDKDLSMYYMVITYNLLDIDEPELADACFNRLTEDFRTDKIRVIAEDLAHLLQRKLEIENSIESEINPGQRAKLMVEYNKARQDAEMLIVITDFPRLAKKSAYIDGSAELEQMMKAIEGFSFELDLDKGKPTIN
jgi:hypothetical protein